MEAYPSPKWTREEQGLWNDRTYGRLYIEAFRLGHKSADADDDDDSV